MMEKQVEIPDILTACSGRRIENSQDWERFRRPELLNLFTGCIYGYCPFPVPWAVSYERIGVIRQGSWGRREQLVLHLPGFSFPLALYLPKGRGPFKVVVYLRLTNERETVIPLDRILQRGYAVLLLWVEDVAPDVPDTFEKGIFKSLSGKRGRKDCGAMGAWSYALSRVMDYIEQDERLLAAKSVLAGFSRGGKCALWTAAADQRFALCAAFHSGCTGAGLSRWGSKNKETVKEITQKFPYWFCEAYGAYGEKEEYLPVDQHMLLALIAPRFLYLAGSLEDPWANPESELESAWLASEAYALYGLWGLKLPKEPKEGKLYKEGRIGCYIHKGVHEMTEMEWELLLDFADEKFLFQ